uniref:Uncharacterized protein n=1 Tax=Rousettus aegyptiacus TaxID=9407 RepID=A0A7J8KAQ1_ROUAE|nr:hypothetical protein HJG63_007798 [Rousettus aegyptiacus]
MPRQGLRPTSLGLPGLILACPASFLVAMATTSLTFQNLPSCPPASDWQAPRQIKSRPLKAKHCRTQAALSWEGILEGVPPGCERSPSPFSETSDRWALEQTPPSTIRIRKSIPGWLLGRDIEIGTFLSEGEEKAVNQVEETRSTFFQRPSAMAGGRR